MTHPERSMSGDDPTAARRPPIRGQVDGQVVPRFAGLGTFARLPRLDEVEEADVAVVGVPFDAGTSFRPGARFGPSHVREASRLLRPYNPALGVEPFSTAQVVDAGDIAANPFDIEAAVAQIEHGSRLLAERSSRIITIGGDHTIALPLLRTAHAAHGPIAVVHFDAHLDTWDTYFGAAYTHGTPFRRAAEEGLLATGHCAHVGLRGPIYSGQDLVDDRDLGFAAISASEFDALGTTGVLEWIRARVEGLPVYVSIDIDVLDPAFAPGTGTPEAGGLTSRELIAVLRGLVGLNIVGADVVEVAPAYDHAQITAVAAAHLIFELLSVFGSLPGGGRSGRQV